MLESSRTSDVKFVSLAVQSAKVKQRKSPYILYPRRTSAAMVPESSPPPALDTASHAHHRRSHYKRRLHQLCAGRHSRTYKCQSLTDQRARISILVSAVLVGSSSRLDDMRRRRFTNAQVEQWRDDGGVHDISCVDECLGC